MSVAPLVMLLSALNSVPSDIAPAPPETRRQECTVEIKNAGWADIENTRSKFEMPVIGPRFRDFVAREQPAIVIVAEDRTGSWLRVTLKMPCAALVDPGAFVAITRQGTRRLDSGALIMHGDPKTGICTDTRKGRQRIDPRNGHKGRNVLLVRFEGEEEKFVSLEVNPDSWRWLR